MNDKLQTIQAAASDAQRLCFLIALKGSLSEDRRHEIMSAGWRIYRLAQAIEARQGGDAKQAPSQDESAVGTMRPEGDA